MTCYVLFGQVHMGRGPIHLPGRQAIYGSRACALAKARLMDWPATHVDPIKTQRVVSVRSVVASLR